MMLSLTVERLLAEVLLKWVREGGWGGGGKRGVLVLRLFVWEKGC